MSEWGIGIEYQHGRTLEGSALATLTLTKEKNLDSLLLPLLIALGLEHLINVIVDFLCLLFRPESLFAVCSGLVRRRKEGGADGVRGRAVSACGAHVGNERGSDGLEEHWRGDGEVEGVCF